MPKGLKIASAFVEIKADTSGLREEVQSGIRRATSGSSKVKITANLDATRAKAEIAKLAKKQTLKLRVAVDASQAKREIRAIGKNITIKVKVVADTTQARRQIAALNRNLNVRVNADANTSTANTQLAFLTRARDVQINAVVNQTSITQITNNLNNVTNGSQRASSAVRLLRIAFIALSVAPQILGAAAVALGTIKTASAIAIPGVLALGAAFAAIKTGLSGIGAALSAGFKPSTASAKQEMNNARQIEDAKRSLMRAQRELEYTSRDSARAIEDAQRNLRDAEIQAAEDRADAARNLARAQEDLKRTYESVARANGQASRRVADAEESLRDAQERARRAQLDLTKARKQAAEQLVDLNNRLKSAQLDQRDAILDLKEAKEALDNAKLASDPVAAANEYTRALADQRAAQEALNAVRAKGDQASEAEKAQAETAFANATARVAQATQNLAKAQSGTTDPDELERLQLAYDRAKQALEEQTIETARLEEETAAANQAGVEGSELVQDAKEDIADANERVEDSTQDLRDAEAEAARTAVEGARQVKDAQEAVADSVRDQAEVYRDSARAIADAQRGVRDANEQAARSMLAANEAVQDSARDLAQAYTDAASAGAAAADEFGDAMKKLSPNARSFVQAVLDIAPAWRKVKLAIQDALFDGWDSKLRELSSQVLPDVQAGLTETAGIFNRMGKSIADSFIELSKEGTLKKLFSGLNDAMKPLEKTPGRLVTAFSQIGVAASPALKRFTNWLADRVDQWADKIDRMFKSGKLEENISGAVERISKAINSFKTNENLQEFLRIMREKGPGAKEVLERVAEALVKIANSSALTVGSALFLIADAAARLVLAMPQDWITFFIAFAGTLKLLMIITKISTAVRAWAIAQYALNGALLLSPMTWLLVGIAALVAIIVVIATKTDWFQRLWAWVWDKIKKAWDATWTGLKAGWDAMGKFFTQTIPSWLTSLKKWFVDRWNEITKSVTGAWTSFKNNVLTPMQNFFTKTIPGWVTTLRTRVSSGWTSMVNSVKNTWNSGLNWVSTKWNSISTSVRNGVSSFGTRIRSSIESAVNGIRSVWNRLEGYFKSPVRFLINTVVNKGIIGSINWVLGKVGVGRKIPTVGLPKGFANGGPVVGPGTAKSDSIPAMLSNGEHVLTAEDVQALGGHGAVMRLRKSGGRAKATMKNGVAHAAFGGAIGDFFSNFAKDPIGSIASGGKWLWDQGVKFTRKVAGNLVNKAYDKILNPLLGSIPFGGSAKDLVKAVPAHLKDKVVDYIKGEGDKKQKQEDAKSGLGNYKPGAGVAQWSGVVRTALSQVGQSQSLVNTTLRRMNQESGGNPRAVNKWDINWQRGYPSVGLMQVIRPTYQAYAGRYRNKGPFMYGTSIDPLANVYASMRYALSAYGSLSRAYNRPGGYARGGTARGLSIVGERGPELINAGGGTRVYSNSESRGLLGGGVTIQNLTVNVDGTLDISSPTDRKKFAKAMVSDIKEAIRKDDLGRGR